MKFQTLLLLFFTASLQSFSQEYYNALLIPNELKENANAVVRLDETFIEIKSINQLLIKKKYIITVLNKEGNKNILDWVYYDNSIKINQSQATVYDAVGKEIKKFKKKDFINQSAVDQMSLYSDAKISYINYTPTQYPYTFEINYQTQTPNTVFIPTAYITNNYNVSVQEYKYNLVYNSNETSVNIKEDYLENLTVLKQIENGNILYISKNIPAIKYEEFSPVFSNLLPKIQFSPTKFHYQGINGSATNWNDFGLWFNNNIVAGRDQLNQVTIEEIKNLTNGIDKQIEKAKKIYEYVQSKTRYISVQVGIGGYQPILASEVDKVKYGDCKGLSNYTKALLKAVGIESYYTRINAGEEQRSVEDEFFSISQTNHVILAIPTENDELVWIDCTSQQLPFGFIGDFNDNRNALILTPQGGKIVRTPKYSADDSYKITVGKYKLLPNGNAEGLVNIKTGGIQYDKRYHLDRATEKEKNEYYKEFWGYLHNLDLKSINHNNDKTQVQYQQDIEFSTTGYASFAANEIILPLNMFTRNTLLPARYSDRKLPFEIRRGYKDVDEIEIEIPQGFEITFIPENRLLDTKYGSYLFEIQKLDNHKVLYKRTFILHDGLYPKEDYELFRNFMRDVTKLDLSKAILTKKL